MAFHPFRTFQKHQKGCMVGAVLLAMISFLFLGVIMQMIGGSGSPGAQIETVAESRRFGKITNYDLQMLRDNHERFSRFLILLYQNIARDLIQEMDETEVKHTLRPFESFINQVEQLKHPEQLVNVWLVTQYAQEEGLSPDWEDAKTLLKELTNDYISEAIYKDTLNAAGFSHQTIEQFFVRHLRWQQSLERLALSASAVTPAIRWDWYQRLHRQVTVEAAAVPVDSLLDQVGEPSTAQLTALFEKYKNRRYNPVSAESGLIMPTELAFQYIVAEPTQELLDSITEEEMLAFYEENKDAYFLKPRTPLGDMQLPGMMPGGGMPMFPVLDGRRQTADGSEDEAAPQTEEPATEPREPATVSPEDGETVSPEESETSATSRVTTRLVVHKTEEEETADGNLAGTPAEEEVAPPIMIPVTPRIIIQEEEEEFSMETETGGLASTALEEDTDAPVDLSILYRPFDEVKDEIRKELAQEKAMVGLPVIQAKMKEYAAVYNENFEQGKPIPPMPDLTGLVAEQGLKLVSVPMGDVYAAMQTELARGLQERQHLIQMFSRIPLSFEGELFLDSNNNLVLYWITDQKPEHRPEKLDEVKDIVVKRWKEIEARALALKKAEEFAKEAKTSRKSLAEFFAGRSMPVVETEPFTWKTYGGPNVLMAVLQGIPPMLGEVREKGVADGDSDIDNTVIVAPGSDFMETVYALSVGEIGVVFNQPQSAAYIVRVTTSSPSTESLWEQFQTAHMLEYIYAGQPEMIMSAREAWLDDIRSKTGFRWVNKPDAREMEMY